MTSDLRPLLADSPAGYWPASELDGDVEVSGPEVGTFSSAFTFEGWVEVGEAQSDRTADLALVCAGDGSTTRGAWAVGGVRLYLDENGHYALAAGNYQHGYVRTSIGPVAGEREHVAGTWDGSVMRLYRNGVQIGSADLAGSLADSSVELTIGREVGQAARLRARAHARVRCEGTRPAASRSPVPVSRPIVSPPTTSGLNLRVVVTGTDDGESSVTASELTPPATARPPALTSPPSILGTSEEGQTLNAADGTWEGTQPLEFSHQWQRCDAEGESCVDIAGATDTSYTLAAADLGATVRLAVTARGLGGELTARSEPSEKVAGDPRAALAVQAALAVCLGSGPAPVERSRTDLEPPTIAIVDSGIDAARADFGGRVIDT